MGDASNAKDVERLMRSEEGKAHLEETRQMLLGRTINDVTFSNETHSIATTLHLNDGTFIVFQPSLEIEAIREEFKDVLEREYLVDYPDRKPD